MDLVTDEAEEPRQRVAVDGVAGAADVDRSGRVGADEFDVDLERRIGDRAAPLIAGGEHCVDRLAVPLVGENKVDEARAGDLGTDERGAELAAELLGELLGKLTRLRA